jgi:NADPH2:quinone reductase
MRAAVIHSTDAPPSAEEFENPQADGYCVAADVLVAGLNPVDLIRASGGLGDVPTPSVAGSEGIARVDGRRVYFASAVSPFGSMAERTLIRLRETFDVPDGLDDGLAVTLGIAGLAAWLPLAHHARVSGGERVLILGATGVAGQLAVQAAKLLGAEHVVAAGRNSGVLERITAADSRVGLGDDPAAELGGAAGDGFDVVVDYVFGEPFAAALEQTKPGGTVVCVGSGAGTDASLAFRALQAHTVVGHANWAVPLDVRRDAFAAMARHVLAGELSMDVERYPLEHIVDAWEAQSHSPHHKLIVVP